MRLVMKRCGAVATAVCALAFGVPAAAEAQTTQTFKTSQSEFDPGVRNQGWWTPAYDNRDENDNYLVGGPGTEVGSANTLVFRNFFTFDLSSACRASSVTLQLTRFEQTGALTYSLFDVSTPAATLNANNLSSQAIFDDLGSGISFGSFPVADGAPNDVLSFPLSAAGVAAFNTTRGGFFSIGGKTPDGEASPDLSFMYGMSGPGAGGTQQLVVSCLERMVGKGSVPSLSSGGPRASYAYILNCDPAPNAPFEVRFGTQRFRLTRVISSSCRNLNGPIHEGTGSGTLTSGGPGVIQWAFADGGAGGTSDFATITIRNAAGTTVFQGGAAPPGKFPGSTQTTGNNTFQNIP